MTETKFSFFYVTTPDLKTAEKIAEALIQAKLIACANILPQMTSLYVWKDKLEKSSECVLILKSFSRYKGKLEMAIKGLHPYEVPCIAELDVSSLNRDYARWLSDQLL